MAEKLAGSEQESPRRVGRARAALAAMGMGSALLAPEALATEKTVDADPKTPVAEQVSEDFAERSKACIAEASTFQREWLKDQMVEAGVAPADAQAWLREKRGDEDFVMELRQAKVDVYNECDRRQDEILLAALEERIAKAQEIYAAHGFRMGENEAGDTVIFLEIEGREVIAGIFVSESPDENSPLSIDFSPLQDSLATLIAERKAELVAESEALQAESEALQTESADLQGQAAELEAESARLREEIERAEGRIRYIWQQFERGEAVEDDVIITGSLETDKESPRIDG